MSIYESGEDYLETIYLLSKANPGVHAINVAEALSFSKPSVTRALKILKTNGFINIDAATNHIILTDKGRETAEGIFDRHETITKFWVLNGVSPEIAAKDACRMEHDISPETFKRVKEIVAGNG
ncbi:MAG: metal-dependent transcriptional regulator [Clostridiales bacterium]|jgi:Mn-dependent DtxR family transcriptional regulator|nr:metal-dependent transcriptional regulator [Clostridiales bacterium]